MEIPMDPPVVTSNIEPLMETLSDAELLAIAQSSLPLDLEVELEHLLYLNREDEISDENKRRLDGLLEINFELKTRKARALRIAMERGLCVPIGDQRAA